MAANGTTDTNTSGEESVAFNFKKKGPSDCISDKNMQEFARRLIGVIKSDELGDVVFAVNPPNNTKKIWIETVPAGGNIGTIKRFDGATGEWVDDHTVLPDEFSQVFPESASEVVLDSGSNDQFTHVFAHNIGAGKYIYTITPTSQPANDSKWWENTKDVNSLSIDFRNSNGVTYRIDILEILEEPEPEV